MPYKKGSLAEQAGKVRRTAKRRIARLEKEISRTQSEKEQRLYKAQIETLRKQISNTYQRNPLTNKATGFTEDSVKMAVQNLQRTNVNSKIGTSSQERKNFITQQELNMARPYSEEVQIGEFTREEVGIFYRATQRAWENYPSNVNRNKLILEYYGETDLRKFVRAVLEENKEAVQRAHEKSSPDYENENELPADSDQQSRAKSADWVAYVNMLNQSTWEELRDDIEE